MRRFLYITLSVTILVAGFFFEYYAGLDPEHSVHPDPRHELLEMSNSNTDPLENFTVDVTHMLSSFDLLDRYEREDRIADWVVYGTLSQYASTSDSTNSAPIGSVQLDRGTGRSVAMPDGKVWLFYSDKDRDYLGTLARLADKTRAENGHIPDRFTLFEYRSELFKGSIEIRHAADVPGHELFSPEYGYVEKSVSSTEELDEFLKSVDYLTHMKKLSGTTILLGGRQDSSHGGARLEIGDVANLYRDHRRALSEIQRIENALQSSTKPLEQTYRDLIAVANENIDNFNKRIYARSGDERFEKALEELEKYIGDVDFRGSEKTLRELGRHTGDADIAEITTADLESNLMLFLWRAQSVKNQIDLIKSLDESVKNNMESIWSRGLNESLSSGELPSTSITFSLDIHWGSGESDRTGFRIPAAERHTRGFSGDLSKNLDQALAHLAAGLTTSIAEDRYLHLREEVEGFTPERLIFEPSRMAYSGPAWDDAGVSFKHRIVRMVMLDGSGSGRESQWWMRSHQELVGDETAFHLANEAMKWSVIIDWMARQDLLPGLGSYQDFDQYGSIRWYRSSSSPDQIALARGGGSLSRLLSRLIRRIPRRFKPPPAGNRIPVSIVDELKWRPIMEEIDFPKLTKDTLARHIDQDLIPTRELSSRLCRTEEKLGELVIEIEGDIYGEIHVYQASKGPEIRWSRNSKKTIVSDRDGLQPALLEQEVRGQQAAQFILDGDFGKALSEFRVTALRNELRETLDAYRWHMVSEAEPSLHVGEKVSAARLFRRGASFSESANDQLLSAVVALRKHQPDEAIASIRTAVSRSVGSGEDFSKIMTRGTFRNVGSDGAEDFIRTKTTNARRISREVHENLDLEGVGYRLHTVLDVGDFSGRRVLSRGDLARKFSKAHPRDVYVEDAKLLNKLDWDAHPGGSLDEVMTSKHVEIEYFELRELEFFRPGLLVDKNKRLIRRSIPKRSRDLLEKGAGASAGGAAVRYAYLIRSCDRNNDGRISEPESLGCGKG